MSTQPVLPNSQGVILTVGMIVNGERIAIVEPYAIEQALPDKDKICRDIVDSWTTAAQTAFLACLSQDASIVYLAADGMQDGTVPFRQDLVPGSVPGTIAHASLPANVTGMIAYYEDPVDVPAGHRISVAKTYMPALPANHVIGQNVDTPLTDLYAAYGAIVVGGFDSTQWPGHDWFRLLATPKPRATPANVKRILVVTPRGYVCTQKRRIVPR